MQKLISLTFLLFASPIFAQPASQDTSGVASPRSFTEISDIESFWAMARLGGGIGYVIMAVLAIGLFLILLKSIELLMDRKNSGRLRKAAYAALPLEEIEGLALRAKNSILGGMVAHLLAFYHVAGGHAAMQQELVAYLDQQSENFETFRSRMNFLSDSAGALGLLGTVWGVFLTFFGGSLDSEKILNGMGVALVTTLLGLVVSLILSFGTTEIFGVFNRRLDTVSKKADELRLRLLREGGRPAMQTPAPGVRPEAAATEKPAVASPPRELRLLLLKSPPESIRAGQKLQDALVFRVVDGHQAPVRGAKINLQAAGAIRLRDGEQGVVVTTNKKGDAEIDLVGGEKTGPGQIIFWLANDASKKQSIKLQVTSGLPGRMVDAGGNDQAAPLGQQLPEPLQVNVTDRFDNPVAGALIQFKVKMGEGVFEGGNHLFETRTDEQGVARARFTLGRQTGFHTVQAFVRDAKVEPVEFRILAKG